VIRWLTLSHNLHTFSLSAFLSSTPTQRLSILVRSCSSAASTSSARRLLVAICSASLSNSATLSGVGSLSNLSPSLPMVSVTLALWASPSWASSSNLPRKQLRAPWLSCSRASQQTVSRSTVSRTVLVSAI